MQSSRCRSVVRTGRVARKCNARELGEDVVVVTLREFRFAACRLGQAVQVSYLEL